jgi:sugar O-acyltransferase (sialic acid O-acetyltransferase NeuD family)
MLEGWEVLGPTIAARAGHACSVAVGNPRQHRALVESISRRGAAFPTVDFSGNRHPTVRIGAGSMLLQGVHTTVHITLGAQTILNQAATISHDVTCGDFVTIAPGAHIVGAVTIGSGVEIGTGAVIREGVRLGDGCMVGMGAVVVKDVPPNKLVVGNPAKPLKELDPW